jgi:ADP-ribose pyrophosphatase YjhB (NUDIX family)/ketosteroid isomerase-like protein
MTDPLDVVREWFAAYNRGDVGTLIAYYAGDSVWDGEDGMAAGPGAIRERLQARFGAWEAALDHGARRRLRTLGRIESGVAAEWVSRERSRHDGTVLAQTGYSHFVVREGLIREHRENVHAAGEGMMDADAQVSSRRYPPRPVVGIGGAIVQDGRVVLIKRRYEPLAGQWSLPGGTLELGETLEAAVAREMLEETGLQVAVGPVVDVFDRILLDPDERVRYHFVLIDYLCRPVGGALCAGSDVADAVYASLDELPSYRLTSKATAVAERALAMASQSSSRG